MDDPHGAGWTRTTAATPRVCHRPTAAQLCFALTHWGSVNGSQTVTVSLPFTQRLCGCFLARDDFLVWLAVFPSHKKAIPRHVPH